MTREEMIATLKPMVDKILKATNTTTRFGYLLQFIDYIDRWNENVASRESVLDQEVASREEIITDLRNQLANRTGR